MFLAIFIIANKPGDGCPNSLVFKDISKLENTIRFSYSPVWKVLESVKMPDVQQGLGKNQGPVHYGGTIS